MSLVWAIFLMWCFLFVIVGRTVVGHIAYWGGVEIDKKYKPSFDDWAMGIFVGFFLWPFILAWWFISAIIRRFRIDVPKAGAEARYHRERRTER